MFLLERWKKKKNALSDSVTTETLYKYIVVIVVVVQLWISLQFFSWIF